MQVENNDLRQYTEERKAKKKRKWNILFTESVLTLEVIKELTAAREAAQKAKEQAKLTRKRLKKDCQVVVELAKEQVKARKAARKRVADIKKLAKVHYSKAGEAGKVAKKAQKDSLTAASIARRKHTREAQLAATIAANYTILKQLTADKLRKRVEESSTTAVTAAALVKQLQEAAKKLAEEAALLKDLQKGQEDDNISNLSNKESLDKEFRLVNNIQGPTKWLIKP